MKKFEDHTKKYVLSRMYDCNTRISPVRSFEIPKNLKYNYFMEIKKKHYCIKSIPLRLDKSMISQEFYQVINNRKSVEELEIRTRIRFKTLSNLLHFSYGYVNKSHSATPSAGAKYPISVYIAIFNVEELEQGIYYYNRDQNTLEMIRKGDFRNTISDLYVDNTHIHSSSFIMFHVANLDQTSSKYEDRGYKLIHLDMGHLSQNLYLLSSAQQLGIRAVFGVYENKVNDFLEIDGENEFVLLSHIFGGIKYPTPIIMDTEFNDIYYENEEIESE
ncbi:SagB/ThcOx family dehydrogenase [Bacillus cereus]|uniref:SagB/ThcOx family dehydrogenase n=1 Tax=Bacillus TaxID=1386 RepID=UPI001FF1D103|nr:MULTISPECIES: SagB/ThcOx family dehydrogenase [Bacillus]MDA2451617.1 SagB/ThcOx family dehydrogenase [Bacillus cereus]MDA2457494.1 SagB/ThcOx family dehydrogenase [Bacillus cereus]MDK3015386.1 SagB/ThcOx family dehydrogenase [Bacillus sp. RB3]MDZ4441660.1 SagB/ThcOx family dehydrogenase [Bacillus cereus]UOX98757.1 SagB/ThcOx family dehydrogenase [Bacillus cereus]